MVERYMKRGWLLCVVLLGGCQQPHEDAVPTSLIRLVSNGEEMSGSRVTTIGFLRAEHRGQAIYLHEEDAANRLTLNAVWVSTLACKEPTGRSIKRGYVLLEATFKAGASGQNDAFAGELVNATRCERWPITPPLPASDHSAGSTPFRGDSQAPRGGS